MLPPGNQTSALEILGATVSRSMAAKLSRRSFVGRLGQGVIALTFGAAGATLFRPASASALSCSDSSCDPCSIACEHLNGFSGGNKCPNGTCDCGSWTVSLSTSGLCPQNLRRWIDCCDKGSWCANHGGPNCNSVGTDGRHKPSCCNHKEWGGCPFDSCTGTGVIVCRRHICVSSKGNCYHDGYCQPG